MTKTEAISLANQQAKKRRERMYVILDPHYVNCYGAEEGYTVITDYELVRFHQGASIEHFADKPAA